MEKARSEFSHGQYGTALKAANQAKANKSREYAWYSSILKNELRAQEVHDADGSFDAVLSVLRERDALVAINIINYFTGLYGEDFHKNSLTKLVEEIERMAVLPEAEKLLGDIYLVEGETGLAKTYYQEAWKHAYALDIPAGKYDILYKLAHIGDLEHNDELYEQSLLLVLADDPYARGFQDKSGAFIKALTIGVERGYSADKFFFMYRADTYRSLKAYLQLARFYRIKGDNDKYFAMASLGCLTAFTRIYTILDSRELEYTFTTLSDFFARANSREEIREWIDANNVLEIFSLFADAVTLHGQQRLAEEITGNLPKKLS
jgi:tetratricopeptide (TPR) repeat protein